MDPIYFPADFSTEKVKAKDARSWPNARLLDALNRVVALLADPEKGYDLDSVPVGRNYSTITNEIRRRMQANVENFVLLEVEHSYNVDKETDLIKKDKDLPEPLTSLNAADAALELLADVDDNIVFIGITQEDYMRTWNRMVERQRKRIYYYSRDDDEDEEHLRLEDDE